MDYIPHKSEDIKRMLQVCGLNNVEELFSSIPPELKKDPLNKDDGLKEIEIIKIFDDFMKDVVEIKTCLAGGGAYRHFIPSVIDSLVSRGEFLTAYTPYQPEISQGILQTIWEYQEIISRLTGMDISNASHYDGSTSLAEAVVISKAITSQNKIVLSEGLNPRHISVLKTIISNQNFNMKNIPLEDFQTNITDSDIQDASCFIIQQPNYYGIIEDLESVAKVCNRNNVLFIVVFNPISAGILKTPGECGADIVTGEGQPLGISLNFGGPGLGFIACKMKYIRYLPGRIVAKTNDYQNRTAFVLTLQAREQHIRREKASSNICSNHALMALRALIYCSLLGDKGLKSVALLSCQNARYLKKSLLETGLLEDCTNKPFFHEFPLKFKTDEERDRIRKKMISYGVLFGIPLSSIKGGILFNTTELVTNEEIDRVISILKEI